MGQEKGNLVPLVHTQWVPGAKCSQDHTCGTRICSPAMSQGASLEAGDKLGSQGQRCVPDLCHPLHPSSLCRNFGIREPDIVSA